MKNIKYLLIIVLFTFVFGGDAEAGSINIVNDYTAKNEIYDSNRLYDFWDYIYAHNEVKVSKENERLFFQFNGKNSYLKFNVKRFNPFPEEGFTYSFFIKILSIGNGRHSSIISCHHNSGNFWNGISLVDDKVELVLQNPDTLDTYYWYSENPIRLNQWYHVTVSYNNLGNQKDSVVFFINDKPAAVICRRSPGSKEFSSDFVPGYKQFDPLGLCIGRLNEDIPNAYFHGELSDFKFFNYPINVKKFELLN